MTKQILYKSKGKRRDDSNDDNVDRDLCMDFDSTAGYICR